MASPNICINLLYIFEVFYSLKLICNENVNMNVIQTALMNDDFFGWTNSRSLYSYISWERDRKGARRNTTYIIKISFRFARKSNGINPWQIKLHSILQQEPLWYYNLEVFRVLARETIYKWYTLYHEIR